MYDKDLTNRWFVEIEFSEDDIHTHASAHARLMDDGSMATTGDAYRNPKDPNLPRIGEEIAAARALIALGTELLHSASKHIEEGTHHPVHLYR
ncbi:dsRBD fold-containing protein [Mycolicibacterium goodii]|uniref:DUF1876 domain-containing protein n=1 Tax=Mycolicibacterium goodii TaxID=134601 RepID=A0ABS6HN66_MYCGD|nr:dsRBD fold-containing protein [Mycolicibacterium goodii]OKH61399.1 hypothetical protein EB74_20330 [Mycobacterium sp. SWH-M5]MBU8813529.1 DUF1876 domain-containing protein [Mycolicibacterium goodii]MBU8818276.1 DUF1876 domain-containing protein [Mycolicibacterium goodii]MBU8823375.1 DUF1876 domain-containing protein [Mycolicibacterium goodii]MBU8833337.1 DUF1876 domain-containing protein [Mycolicibacterium goodii]